MSDVKADIKHKLDVAGHHVYVTSAKGFAETLIWGTLTLPLLMSASFAGPLYDAAVPEQGTIDTHNSQKERIFTEDLDTRLDQLRDLSTPYDKRLSIEDYIIEHGLERYTDEDEAARLAFNEEARSEYFEEIDMRINIEDRFYIDVLMNPDISEDTFKQYAKKFNKLALQDVRELPVKTHNFHDECRVESVKDTHSRGISAAPLDAAMVAGCMHDSYAEFRSNTPFDTKYDRILLGGVGFCLGMLSLIYTVASVENFARKIKVSVETKKKPQKNFGN